MVRKKINLLRTGISLFLTAIMLFTCTINIFAAENGWKPAADTQIFWVSTNDSVNTDKELEKQLQLFCREMTEKLSFSKDMPIVYGAKENAGENDILVILDRSLGIAAEGYTIEVKDSQVTVYASDADGLFYGCRNLMKQLMIAGSVSEVSDAPDVGERGLSLDNGRKYYSVDWIKQMIRELSWADMNTLVLHFSEEMGWGIESKLYPWLNGRDGKLCTQAEVATDNRYLTQDEVAEIAEYAKLYHVDLIPSIDSPGHLNYLVKKFNEKCATKDYSFSYNGKTYTAKAGSEIGNYYHYNGKTSIVKGSRNTEYSRGIDISNEVAVAFVHSLIEEYGKLFYDLGCRKFDIGGDELLGWGSAIVSGVNKWQQLDHWKTYAQNRAKTEGISNWSSAVAYDGFMYYMNDLYDLVTSLGYTSVRMWNDDALRSSDTGWKGVVQLNTNIDIWFWTTGNNSVWTYANKGYQVYNILSDYNYYAMTSDYFSDNRESFAQSYPDQIYNEWTPYTFDPTSTTLGSGKNMAIGNANVLGSAFAIWSDNPTLRTEDQVMSDVLPMLRAHGAKAWDAMENKEVSYSTFTANLEKLKNAPEGDMTNPPEVTEFKKLDTTAFDAAVAEYEAADAAAYTAESWTAYENAVNEAKIIRAAEGTTQDVLDAAVEKIAAMKANLLENNKVSSRNMFTSLVSRSTRVAKDKYVTLAIVAKETITGVEIYDDLGNRVELKSFSIARNSTPTKCSVTIQFKETNRGTRTYTVYAVAEDGLRSADSMTCTVVCY